MSSSETLTSCLVDATQDVQVPPLDRRGRRLREGKPMVIAALPIPYLAAGRLVRHYNPVGLTTIGVETATKNALSVPVEIVASSRDRCRLARKSNCNPKEK